MGTQHLGTRPAPSRRRVFTGPVMGVAICLMLVGPRLHAADGPDRFLVVAGIIVAVLDTVVAVVQWRRLHGE